MGWSCLRVYFIYKYNMNVAYKHTVCPFVGFWCHSPRRSFHVHGVYFIYIVYNGCAWESQCLHITTRRICIRRACSPLPYCTAMRDASFLACTNDYAHILYARGATTIARRSKKLDRIFFSALTQKHRYSTATMLVILIYENTEEFLVYIFGRFVDNCMSTMHGWTMKMFYYDHV